MADAKMTVTVIGAGRGGTVVAAHFGGSGAKVRMHDRNDARLAELRTRGGIELEGEGGGFVALEKVTTDLGDAVKGADVIVVCTGGVAQEGFATMLAPVLTDGQIILLIQGNTGGGRKLV